eukprot:m51a1_g2105 putative tetratricopeptide repeat protein (950) ;mRNA; r:1608767-1612655
MPTPGKREKIEQAAEDARCAGNWQEAAEHAAKLRRHFSDGAAATFEAVLLAERELEGGNAAQAAALARQALIARSGEGQSSAGADVLAVLARAECALGRRVEAVAALSPLTSASTTDLPATASARDKRFAVDALAARASALDRLLTASNTSPVAAAQQASDAHSAALALATRLFGAPLCARAPAPLRAALAASLGALPGLLLAQDRFAEAVVALRAFLAECSQGQLPSRACRGLLHAVLFGCSGPSWPKPVPSSAASSSSSPSSAPAPTSPQEEAAMLLLLLEKRFAVDALAARASALDRLLTASNTSPVAAAQQASDAHSAALALATRLFGAPLCARAPAPLRAALAASLGALPGLLLAQDRFAEAVVALRAFLAECSQGQLPSRACRGLLHAVLFGCSGPSWPKPVPSSAASSSSSPSSAPAPTSPQEEAAMLLLLLEKFGEDVVDEGSVLWGVAGLAPQLAGQLERGADASRRAAAADKSPDARLWRHLAHALVAAGRNRTAACVVDQCIAASPCDAEALLLAAHLFLGPLSAPLRAVELARQGLAAVSAPQTDLGVLPQKCWVSRFNLVAGVAAGHIAAEEKIQQERAQWQTAALRHLHAALVADPADHSVNHFLALQYADMRELDLGLYYAHTALDLNPASGDSWNLLSLLLSARQWDDAARHAIETGLSHCPGHIGLLTTKAKLELKLNDPISSLRTGLCEERSVKSFRNVTLPQDAICEIRSEGRPSMDVRSDFDRRSLSVASLTADVGIPRMSTVQDPSVDPNAVMLPPELCCTLSEAFAVLGQYEDARAVLSDQLVALSAGESAIRAGDRQRDLLPGLLRARGNIEAMERGTPASEEALILYERALSVDPDHMETLLDVAAFHNARGERLMEESSLLSILRSYPYSHHAWLGMGTMLKDKRQASEAAQCFMTAVRLEATSPVVPFSCIPRTVVDLASATY